MDPPVVSVVVPTRGRAAYLEVTLDSLLGQRAGIAHEILVVDDGDAGATADVVRARPTVRYVPHGSRRGLNAARNAGLRSRPLQETVRDTLAWFQTLPPDRQAKLKAGLDPQKEADTLKAWHEDKGKPS